jgi:hypothetical protein
MAGNPLIHNASFYKLTWGDLQSQMPFASDMQRYEAAEKLQHVLNTVFTREARRLAYEYEQSDRKRIEDLKQLYDLKDNS